MSCLLIAPQTGSKEFERPLRRLGVPCRLATLSEVKFGDFVFSSQNGPRGRVRVGIERKTIDEMVSSTAFRRFKGHQLPGLLKSYPGFAFLIVEGLTRVDPRWGMLLSAFELKRDLYKFTEAGFGRERDIYERYKKRELTLRLKACLHVMPTSDATETAHLIHAIYRWFQKPWDQHVSAYEVEQAAPDFAILDERTFIRQIVAQFPNVGWKRSARVSRFFKSVEEAASADVELWMQALGVKDGRKIATRLVHVLRGMGGREDAKA